MQRQPSSDRAPRLVWAGFLGSQVLFLGVALWLVPAKAGDPEFPLLAPALAVLALADVFLAHWFRRRARAATEGQPPGLGPSAELRPEHIVAWACDEAVSIYGLLLAFLGFGTTVWAPFFAAGLLFTVLHRPG